MGSGGKEVQPSCSWDSLVCQWQLWLVAPCFKGLESGKACFTERGSDLMISGSYLGDGAEGEV